MVGINSGNDSVLELAVEPIVSRSYCCVCQVVLVADADLLAVAGHTRWVMVEMRLNRKSFSQRLQTTHPR